MHVEQVNSKSGKDIVPMVFMIFFLKNKRTTEVKQNLCIQSSVTAVNFIQDTFNRGILNFRQHRLELH